MVCIVYYMNYLVPYSATVISISGRFVFMYLLYTKKSTNAYSLLFLLLYGLRSQMIDDRPLLVRGSSDIVLFSISTESLQNCTRILK